MDKKNNEYHEMTNDEFLKEIKRECENNEEFREEINEITGIFIRAIAKGYPNFEDNEEDENEIKTIINEI